MREMTFDEINEIFMNMSDADYQLTKQGAEDFYQFNDPHLLMIASRKVGLDPEIILAWW